MNAPYAHSRVYFAYLDIVGDPVRVNSSGDPLYWTGNSGSTKHLWHGVGALGALSGVSDDTDMGAAQMTLTLNDVPLSHVDAFGDDPTNYQERDVEIWQCDLSENHQVISSVLVWSGEMATANATIGSTGAISLMCETPLARWDGLAPSRLNNATHQRDYPDDFFFQYTAVNASTSIEF